jgi:DNA-binding CsgD family transcriptional regulator
VCRALKSLAGADQATFIFDLPNEEAFFSEELDLAILHAYPAAIRELDVKWNAGERHAAAGVYNRELLWGSNLRAYFETPYYNEFIRSIRGFHALGLADALNAAPVIGRMPNIVLHRWKENAPTFDGRTLQKLRLIFPAFRASARLLQAISSHGTHLVQLLDGIRHAVYALDHCGKRHRNRVFDQMLAAEPERVRLLDECERAARSALALRVERLSLDDLALSTARYERTVQTGRGVYNLHASLIPHPISRAHPCAVVLVEAPRREPRLSATRIREEYGLTQREVQVAYLLADRLRQGEIARALHISVHTARRHTENVMQKLGVQSREAVATRIRES